MALTVKSTVTAKEALGAAVIAFLASVAVHSTTMAKSDIHVHAAWHWDTLYAMSYFLLGGAVAFASLSFVIWYRFNR